MAQDQTPNSVDSPSTGPAAGPPDPSVRDWVEAWGREVAAVDLTAGRARFRPDAVAFGTHADVVRGLDSLFEQQWSQIWPKITGFRFRTEHLVTLVSADGCQAVAIVGWDSTGYHADGEPFDRPGRATIVLDRAAADEPWQCTHTHFSLARDVPSQTHGAPTPDPVDAS